MFTDFIDLASQRVGGRVLLANDEFFGPKENLLKVEAPISIPDKYTEFGKWMDGWETRRRREPGNDWCVIRLGFAGNLHGINVNTAHFLGNHPQYCSLEAASMEAASIDDELRKLRFSTWKEIFPKTCLMGGVENLFPIGDCGRWTHVRFHIYPDGGVARLRIYGTGVPDWETVKKEGNPIDLAAVENGGRAVTCNDMFFGPKNNLIMPGRAIHMGDGWETRRKRGLGNDWIVLRLGTSGKIKKIEIDTGHFKGNHPESCSVEGFFAQGELPPSYFHEGETLAWKEILPKTPLKPDYRHFFEAELNAGEEVFNYLRLNIFPDGGISRLRVHGVAAHETL